jgi:hypothetical protein
VAGGGTSVRTLQNVLVYEMIITNTPQFYLTASACPMLDFSPPAMQDHDERKYELRKKSCRAHFYFYLLFNQLDKN